MLYYTMCLFYYKLKTMFRYRVNQFQNYLNSDFSYVYEKSQKKQYYENDWIRALVWKE